MVALASPKIEVSASSILYYELRILMKYFVFCLLLVTLMLESVLSIHTEDYGLPEQKIAEIRAGFQQVDSDDSGVIDRGELKQLFRTIFADDIDIDASADAAFMKTDENGDGLIDFEEYMALAAGSL